MIHARHSPETRRLMQALMKTGYVNVPGASPVTPDKAREMLSHGTVHGKRITPKQRRYFGFIAHGGQPTRT